MRLPYCRARWIVTCAGLLGLLALPSAAGRAQQPRATALDTTTLTDRVEQVLAAVDDAPQTAQAAERVAELVDQPVNVNRASAAALTQVPGLSGTVARRLVQRRRADGPFEQWAEVRALPGLSPSTLRAVRPMLHLGAAPTGLFPSLRTLTTNLSGRVTQRYARDLDLGRGHRTGRFAGGPARLTTRLRLRHERRLELALTLDKDPGEALQWAPASGTYGFDHVVGSVTLRDLGPVRTAIVGDFAAQLGHGVALWQGLRFGGGRNPVSPVLQPGRGVVPYRSASESNFFRGAAATVGLPANLSLTAFVSRRRRDATVDSSAAGTAAASGPLPVRTLSSGGLHRTAAERARKGTFGETTMGGAVEWRPGPVHVGAAGYHAMFNRPLRPGTRPSRRHRVSGRQTSMMSLYATAAWSAYSLFGEVARAPTGAYGGLAGALVERPRAAAVVLGRWYPPALAGLYGNAFSAGSRPQNEQGVYLGARVQVAERWTVRASFDQFRAPWLRFNVPRPTTGWDGRAVLEYAPRPWLSSYLQVRAQGREEATERPGPAGRPLEAVQEERRTSLRWHTQYRFSDALTTRTRVEWSRHTTPAATAHGILLSQGLRWTPISALHVDVGLSFFDTDGFAARIYAYERDLRYSFSVPVFFDEGRRSYVMAQYAPWAALTVAVKYGITTYARPRTIGSGLNALYGTSRRALRAQVQWRF